MPRKEGEPRTTAGDDRTPSDPVGRADGPETGQVAAGSPGSVRDPKIVSLEELLDEIAHSIADEDLAKLPTDFSLHPKHYLYGAPKE
jgi:hypothetical protein